MRIIDEQRALQAAAQDRAVSIDSSGCEVGPGRDHAWFTYVAEDGQRFRVTVTEMGQASA